MQQQLISDIVKILRASNIPLEDVIAAYNDTTTIPATIFDTSLTPLQAATTYLSTKGHDSKKIAKLLTRPKNVVENAIKKSKEKAQTIGEESPEYLVPCNAFNKTHTPQETIVLHLSTTYELSNAEIARILGRDVRNIWHILQSAKEKGGVSQ